MPCLPSMCQASSSSAGYTFTNWSQTQVCQPKFFHLPSTLGEVQMLVNYVRKRGETIKCVGAGHSPADIMCTKDHMVSLERLNRVLDVDVNNRVIKVEGGITLKQLNEQLPSFGLALSNLGSISEQSIAGAISTGTHGTGIHYGILATSVVELELVAGTGEVVTCSRAVNRDIFLAACCSLGALGIITKVTIQCEEAFYLSAIRKPFPLTQVLQNLDSFLASGDHVRFHYYPHTQMCSLWSASRTTQVPKSETLLTSSTGYVRDKLLGYNMLEQLLWLASFQPELVPYINKLYFHLLYNKTTQEVDESHRIFNFDCLFKQYVTEWAIPKEHVANALFDIREFICKRKLKVHFPIEVRFVKGDDIWLSPCYKQDSCFIGIIMYRPFGKDVPYQEYFSGYETIMQKYGGRPHWAKVFSLRDEHFSRLYPMWHKFKRLRSRVDPDKIFWNDYLQRIFEN